MSHGCEIDSTAVPRGDIHGSRTALPRFRAALLVLPILCCVLMTGCASETLFRSNFDATPVGQPPSPTQSVGTAAVFAPGGGVSVVNILDLPGKFVEISRPNGPQVAGMQGKLSQFRGNGQYTFSATMFMPAGSHVATIQFEAFDNPASNLQAFLHLDFTEQNQIRLDDNEATAFGSFVRDQPFIVQVTLNINDAASTANIVLSGGGADGQKTYTVLGPFQNLSRQFGAFRVWQGFPHTGRFDAANIAVTRRTN